MAYILEKIGNTYNLPKKYFTCDAKSDLDGISLIDVPIGSEAYCILEEESYILDSNKQWHKKKIGEDLTGQVQADLSQTDSTQADYVKGIIRKESLPEGYPYKGMKVILDGTFEFVYNSGSGVYTHQIMDENFTIVDGKTYTIIWDGETYQCVATIVQDTLVLGNLAVVGIPDSDTGEPFVFANGLIGTNSTAATHTVIVRGEIAYPIAPEFLPEGYPYKSRGVILSKTTVQIKTANRPVDLPFTINFIERSLYEVIWDGITYEVVAANIQGATAIGNAALADMGDDTGEPFVIASVDGRTVLFAETAGSHTISIIGKIIHPMAAEFLPDEYVTETELASKGYLTSIPNEYVTETELASKGYLTAIPNEYITSLGNKQDKLTFDTKPTSGSTNPVTSGGIKSYVDAAQVQSDWSINDKNNSAYIKNRPFYDATSYTSIYVSSSKLPEATTLNEGTGLYYGTTNYNSPSLEAGQKYKFIYFNGNSNETFILTASSYKLSSGYTYVEVLGNAQLGADYGLIDTSYAQFPVSDTGEPFCFIVYRTSRNAIVARNKNGKLSSFYKVNEELVQLDVKYLPDHTHDFSELTITDLEAAKAALTIENRMILKKLQAAMPSSANWASITYGNGKFVAVTYNSNAAAAYSEDGITWTATTLPSTTVDCNSVTYGNGKFVAVASGSDKAAYSEDGITWTAATLHGSRDWKSVTYGNGKFVAMAYDSNFAAYSEDGITWTDFVLPNIATKWISITYGNGKFVAVVNNSSIAAYSEDGITWTETTLPSSANWQSVTYGNDKFVAITNSETAAYSEDGITWTKITIPDFINWYSVTYGNGKFVAVAFNSSKVAYSEDGITWTAADTLPSAAIWESVTYGNGKFVAVAFYQSTAPFSYDGINWQTELKVISQNGEDVTTDARSAIGIPAYSTANNGQFLRVIDGIPTWTEFLPTLTSPNGTKYQLTVSDDGTLSAKEVTY